MCDINMVNITLTCVQFNSGDFSNKISSFKAKLFNLIKKEIFEYIRLFEGYIAWMFFSDIFEGFMLGSLKTTF